MWIARDSHECLWLFEHKPVLDKDLGDWNTSKGDFMYIKDAKGGFTDLTLENSPIEVVFYSDSLIKLLKETSYEEGYNDCLEDLKPVRDSVKSNKSISI